jgi:hypothetical protein
MDYGQARQMIFNTINIHRKPLEETTSALFRTLIHSYIYTRNRLEEERFCKDLIPRLIEGLAYQARYDNTMTAVLTAELSRGKNTHTQRQGNTVVTAPKLLPRNESRRNVVPVVTPVVAPVDNGNSGLCTYCLEKKSTMVFLPCGHCCMCRSCWAQYGNTIKDCPICRGEIKDSIPILEEDNKYLKSHDNMYVDTETKKIEYFTNEDIKSLRSKDQNKKIKIRLASRMSGRALSTQETNLETEEKNIELEKLLCKLHGLKRSTQNQE